MKQISGPMGSEPVHGSVILTSGLTGTAWQRFYSDGRWHSVTGHVLSWDALWSLPDTHEQGVIVVHDPCLIEVGV